MSSQQLSIAFFVLVIVGVVYSLYLQRRKEERAKKNASVHAEAGRKERRQIQRNQSKNIKKKSRNKK